MLTPADVEQKTFSTALRGYDLDEVDDFLDEVVATIKGLTEQLEEARSARDVATLAPTPAAEEVSPPEPVATEPVAEEPVLQPRPEIDETAIGRALVAAQTAADKLLEDAGIEATRIVDSARSEADSWNEERDAKRMEAEAEMAALASRVAAVRAELSVLAGEVSEKLNEMDSVITGPIEDVTEVDGEGLDGQEAGAGEGFEHDGDHTEWLGSRDDGEVTMQGGESDQEDEATDVEGTTESDQLDAMLNGVATDLQLDSDEEPEESEDSEPD